MGAIVPKTLDLSVAKIGSNILEKGLHYSAKPLLLYVARLNLENRISRRPFFGFGRGLR